ncbi:MAG: DUF455 family protein [Deltaproteobacteria bacterium]|nr:DUF455 family protein [Deltaproteobacteria bacterium]
MTAIDDAVAPEEGTVERWAWDYVVTTSLAHKLDPPPPPSAWASSFAPRRLEAPGRPPGLRVEARAEKKRSLATPRGRAQVLHTFFHHELQAAELMAWAVLAFADAPEDMRRGLVRITLDETRHMRVYAAEIERLGHRIGDFPVRDWFWQRIPTCRDAASFMAVMGLGLESANLEHAATFAAKFREAGDESAARAQELVGREEIAHVRFAVRWFPELAATPSGLDFTTWQAALPEPLTPLLMRALPLAREARARAGQPEAFLDELEAWTPA